MNSSSTSNPDISEYMHNWQHDAVKPFHIVCEFCLTFRKWPSPYFLLCLAHSLDTTNDEDDDKLQKAIEEMIRLDEILSATICKQQEAKRQRMELREKLWQELLVHRLLCYYHCITLLVNDFTLMMCCTVCTSTAKQVWGSFWICSWSSEHKVISCFGCTHSQRYIDITCRFHIIVNGHDIVKYNILYINIHTLYFKGWRRRKTLSQCLKLRFLIVMTKNSSMWRKVSLQ